MNMEEKNKVVTQYLYNTFSELKQLCAKDKGYFINEDKYKRALDMFLNCDEDIDTIIKMIDFEKKKLLDSYYKWEEQERQAYLSQFENKTDENEKLGITLNRQMIELMMIANASSIKELRELSVQLSIDISDQSLELEQMRELVFNEYINSLTDRNEIYKNPSANLNKKISNVIKGANLTPEQIDKLKLIIQTGMQSNISADEIFQNISRVFPREISNNIFIALSESRDLSDPGINQYQIPDYQLLFAKLREFKSITLDFESKHPAVYMPNGNYYYKKLERCLDFAQGLGKDVRLNALIFFEDCPKHLSELEYNEINKQRVYDELLKYVDSTTQMIASYNQMSLENNGYEVVKSIDIFNELVTRFSNDFNGQYLNREDIPKNNSQESGWQKFLNIEDLCEIALVARKNLPNVEFVYNEVNLEDNNKLQTFKSVLDRIKAFEEKHKEMLGGKKIVDCIGTQMHLRSDVTEKEIDSSLNKLSSYGYPIKITEYDQALTDDYIATHSPLECETEKQRKQVELKNLIVNSSKKYNIRQVTIWSLTDSTNFLLDKQNKTLIQQGKEPVKTIYGGAFRNKKVFDYRTSGEIQVANQIRQKNHLIKQQKSQARQMHKPKVRTLTYPRTPDSISNNGFINVFILSLIVGIVAGALFMIIYMVIR